MNNEIVPFLLCVVGVVAAVTVVILGTIFSRRFLGVPRRAGLLVFVFSLGAGVVASLSRRQAILDATPFHQWPDRQSQVVDPCLAAGLCFFLLIPFVIKLYLKWVGGGQTPAEKLPGAEGLRAWLGIGNVLFAALIPVFAWLGYGYSAWNVAALTFGALLICPLVNTVTAFLQPEKTAPGPVVSPERERVLKMLDEGKINATESAELLNALGSATPVTARLAPAARSPRKLILLGMALLLVGFFLPWFSYNPGEETSRAMTAMQNQMLQMMPHGDVPDFARNVSGTVNGAMVTPTAYIAAGDLKYGLGWAILFVGLAMGLLPFLAENLSDRNRRKITLIGLGVGFILLTYLLTQNLRYVSVGILLALAGYVMQLLGNLKEKLSQPG